MKRSRHIDEAFDAYLKWRDAAAQVCHAYRQWGGAAARDARARTFWAYRAALEREEHAAGVYGEILGRLEARASDDVASGPRTEKRRRSRVRPLLS